MQRLAKYDMDVGDPGRRVLELRREGPGLAGPAGFPEPALAAA